MVCHLASCILGHSKWLLNIVIREIDGFYSNNNYYWDTGSAYIHHNPLSNLADKGFVGKSLGLGNNFFGNAGIIYSWFLAPKIKICLVNNGYYGVISAERSSKGFSKEHRMIKFNGLISLSEG